MAKLVTAEDKSYTSLVALNSCRGEAVGCPNALIDTVTWRDALDEWARERDISQRLRQGIDDHKSLYHHKLRIAIAGCPNGCSRPQIADVGVTGFVRPLFDLAECTGCGECSQVCPDQAISLADGRPAWDEDKCLGCKACSQACPADCITYSQPAVRLLMGGKLGRHPHLADQVLETPDPEIVLDYLDRIIQQYLETSEKGQRFAAWWVGRDQVTP